MDSKINEVKNEEVKLTEILQQKNNEELEEKKVETVNGLIPPSNPIYDSYLEAIKKSYDYAIDEDGYFNGFDFKGNSFPISNFVGKPVKEITKDDGEDVEKTLRIEGVLTGGRPLPTIDLPIAEFASMNWVLHKWGIEASIKPGNSKKDMCRDAIQSMAHNIEREHIYTHLGFRKLEDGRWVYLHSGGCIGAENVSVDIEKTLSRYTLPKNVKDIKEAVTASLSLIEIAPKEITIPLLAFTYLTPLLESFRIAGIEPNFIIWLLGISGSRKTTLALLYLDHFGNFNTKTPPASFKDTVNNIERKAFATKDSMILVDDYHPESSRADASKMEQIAQKILRMFGDRIGRGRLTSTIEFQKSYPPRGNAIATGEDIPKGQSSIARLMALELLKGDVNLEKLTQCQNSSNLLGEAMVGYIQWLIPQLDELPTKLASIFKNLRGKYQEISAHGRLGEIAAWLYIGYRMMLQYMSDEQAITKEDLVTMSNEFDEILIELIKRQNSLLKQEQPSDIFLRAISELFATGKVYVESIDKSFKDFTLGSNGEKIGYKDENYYYLHPETTYNVVSRFLAKRNEILPVKEKMLWRHLDEANIIYVEREANGRVHRCPKKNIPNDGKECRPRLLHLRRDAVEK